MEKCYAGQAVFQYPPGRMIFLDTPSQSINYYGNGNPVVLQFRDNASFCQKRPVGTVVDIEVACSAKTVKAVAVNMKLPAYSYPYKV